jgi:hypothetical protein
MASLAAFLTARGAALPLAGVRMSIGPVRVLFLPEDGSPGQAALAVRNGRWLDEQIGWTD